MSYKDRLIKLGYENANVHISDDILNDMRIVLDGKKETNVAVAAAFKYLVLLKAGSGNVASQDFSVEDEAHYNTWFWEMYPEKEVEKSGFSL